MVITILPIFSIPSYCFSPRTLIIDDVWRPRRACLVLRTCIQNTGKDLLGNLHAWLFRKNWLAWNRPAGNWILLVEQNMDWQLWLISSSPPHPSCVMPRHLQTDFWNNPFGLLAYLACLGWKKQIPINKMFSSVSLQIVIITLLAAFQIKFSRNCIIVHYHARPSF